VRYGVWCI